MPLAPAPTPRRAYVVSVGTNNVKRRSVNVAPGVGPNDAVTVQQLQAVTAASAAAVAPVSSGNDANLRQELTALRALVQRLEGLVSSSRRGLHRSKAARWSCAPGIETPGGAGAVLSRVVSWNTPSADPRYGAGADVRH